MLVGGSDNIIMTPITNLRRTIKKFAQQGTNVYAQVESLEKGMCTCIVNGTTQRLTNLAVADTDIAVGDNVLIDYSSGIPPYVRRLSGLFADEDLSDAELSQERATDDSSDIGPLAFNIYSTLEQTVSANHWAKVMFNAVNFDDANYFPLGTSNYIEIENTGLYLINAQIAVTGLAQITSPDFYAAYDSWDLAKTYKFRNDARYCELRLVSTGSAGVFCYRQIFFPWQYPETVHAQRSLSSPVLLTTGDRIYLEIKPVVDQASITIPVAIANTYPKMSGVLLNFTPGDNFLLGLE